MLAVFDASGHESDQPFMVVAGFVSSAGDWDEFSRLWLERLGRDGLPYFHANQFASGSGIFKGWRPSDARTIALASELMALIRQHAYRYFVQGVRPSEFAQAFTPEERKNFDINAYALCGRTAVADLGRFLRGSSLTWDNTRIPDLVFEDGDIGKGRLRDMLVRHNWPVPTFLPGKQPKPTKSGVVKPLVPLQAADWLAYEFFRLLKLDTIERDEWRWAAREFFSMPGHPGFWTLDGLHPSERRP
jgi:hypothetical protein